MKVDRLLGIVTLLLQKKKVKAKELAEYFEVSLRTIYRDIEDINRAGIPIISFPGGNGGIAIADGFTLDRNVFTQEEIKNIIFGLKGLESVASGSQIRNLLDKFPQEQNQYMHCDPDLVIDLASHYKNSLSEKISLLREAIHARRVVEFEYYSKNGHTCRQFEPYFITFKWSAWYVFGHCRLRDDFRLFKLNRLTKLALTEILYEFREIPQNQRDLEAFYLDLENRRYAILLLDHNLEYIAVDEYGPDSYKVVNEDMIITRWDYVNQQEMVKKILGLGSSARVIAPPDLVEAVKLEAQKIFNNYLES